MAETRSWRDIAPEDATGIDLSADLSIDAPLSDSGERCPWPWEPQQLTGVPLGQYHCGYCGSMVVAGVPHPDYREIFEEESAGRHRESECSRCGDHITLLGGSWTADDGTTACTDTSAPFVAHKPKEG